MMKIRLSTHKRSVLSVSISTIALCSVLSYPALGMYHQKQDLYQKEAGPYERRYPSVRGGKKRGGMETRAFRNRGNASFYNSSWEGDLVDEGETSWENTTQRNESDDILEQKLTQINTLKEFFFKGYLEITPENYKTLVQHIATYETAFKEHDRGIALKGWKSSLGFEPLLDLLRAFQKVKAFKANIEWNNNEDTGEILARAIQSYEDLTELHLAHCKLTDEAMTEIMQSVKYPEKLKRLNLRNNSLTKSSLVTLIQHFPKLECFKCDEDLAELHALIPDFSAFVITTQNSESTQQDPSITCTVASGYVYASPYYAPVSTNYTYTATATTYTTADTSRDGYNTGGRRKETPEEYRLRQERNAQQKKEKQEKYKEKLEGEAKNLGLSISPYESIDSLKSSIRQKKQERYERRQSIKDEIDAKWSYCRGMPKSKALRNGGYSGYRIGSSSDPEAAKYIVEENKWQRQHGVKISYKDNLTARHAYETLHPSSIGRMVGDGRGGTFFAAWGKDDN